MRGMKKRAWTAIALLIAILFGAAACAKQTAQLPAREEASLELERDVGASNNENIVLYFPGVDDPERLYAENRSVSVYSASSMVDVAIEALLKGPQNKELYAVIPKDVRLIMTEQSSNLVTVHLSSELLQLEDRQLLLAKISIINTLTSLSGVEYVTLMCDEKEVPVMGYTSGAEGMFIGTLDEKIAQIENALASGENERKITLYFQDGTGDYLLPEVRTVSVSDDMAQTAFRELLSGPVDTVRCTAVLPSDLTLVEEPKLSTLSDGTTLLTINVSNDPEFWRASSGQRMMRVGAIVLSMTSNMADVDAVSVLMDSVPINRYVTGSSDYLRASMFRNLVGDTMTLFFPNESASMLVEVQRIVDQSSVGRAREILRELFEGPNASETPRAAPLAANFSDSDVLGIRIQNGLMTVNLTSDAVQRLFALDRDGQETNVYAIVNSLCQLQGVTRVRFIAEGQSIISGGEISLENPLMPNIGLVN